MKIGPLFKWFGSKWQSAKRYPVPLHDTIVEPFAGGAGFSLNYADRKVVIWDDDPNLQVLWPWLIQAKPSEILEIPLVPPGTSIQSLGLSRGQALLLQHWQRTNSVGDCQHTSPWGHMPGQWTANTRARVADQIGAVAHWQFVCSPPPTIEAHWFIDPPYLYNYRYRASLPTFDHAKLARFVSSIATGSAVVVCEAARKTDGTLPDYLPFVANHHSVTSRRKAEQAHHSAECIYIRGAA